MPRRVKPEAKKLLSRRSRARDKRQTFIAGTSDSNRQLVHQHQKNPSKYPGVPQGKVSQDIANRYSAHYRSKKQAERATLNANAAAKNTSGKKHTKLGDAIATKMSKRKHQRKVAADVKRVKAKQTTKDYNADYNKEVKRLQGDKSIKGTGSGRTRDNIISDMAHKNVGGVNPVNENLSSTQRSRKHRAGLSKKQTGKSALKKSATQKAKDYFGDASGYEKVDFKAEYDLGNKLTKVSVVDAVNLKTSQIRVHREPGQANRYYKVSKVTKREASNKKAKRAEILEFIRKNKVNSKGG